MFTQVQANSAAPPQDNSPDALTSIKDVSALIRRVLNVAPKLTTAADTLSLAFAAYAVTDITDTLDDLYEAFPASNITEMKDHYDSLDAVSIDSTTATL